MARLTLYQARVRKAAKDRCSPDWPDRQAPAHPSSRKLLLGQHVCKQASPCGRSLLHLSKEMTMPCSYTAAREVHVTPSRALSWMCTPCTMRAILNTRQVLLIAIDLRLSSSAENIKTYWSRRKAACFASLRKHKNTWAFACSPKPVCKFSRHYNHNPTVDYQDPLLAWREERPIAKQACGIKSDESDD